MEDDKDDLLKEVNTLTKTKEDLEGFLKETCDELKWYKQKEMSEEDLKLKLEQLREKGIVEDNYDLK